MMRTTAFALAIAAWAPLAHSATIPVTGWMVHNDGAAGGTTVGGTSSLPTFTPGDNSTLMAPFTDVTLANDGDYVEATTTLTLNNRTGTATNALNTQLRFALMSSTNATLTAGDSSNLGFTIEYGNSANGPLTREQTNAASTTPFVSPSAITPSTANLDPNGRSIQGANPGAVTFTIKLTRNAGALDMVGSISGIDTGDSNNPYLSTFGWTAHTSANFPLNGAFNFNRLGVFLGGNANAESAELSNSLVTTNVPEPASCMLIAIAMAGAVWMPLRRRRAASAQ